MFFANFNLSERFTNIDWHLNALNFPVYIRICIPSSRLKSNIMLSEFEYRELRKSFSRFYISNNGSINTTLMCFLGGKNSNHRLKNDLLSHSPLPWICTCKNKSCNFWNIFYFKLNSLFYIIEIRYEDLLSKLLKQIKFLITNT